jgi:preprotein translocase subunit SecE
VNKFYIQLLIWVVVIAVVFGVLWRTGQLLRLTNYVQETKEELKKCTWPSRDELKGSTFVVIISILLLGGFTVIVDRILYFVVALITRG